MFCLSAVVVFECVFVFVSVHVCVWECVCRRVWECAFMCLLGAWKPERLPVAALISSLRTENDLMAHL